MDSQTGDTAIGFLRRLIAAGRDGEAAVQDCVATALHAAGCSVEKVTYRPEDVPMLGEFAGAGVQVAGERTSVVGRLKGRGGGRSLVLFAHPDSEPVAETGRWTRDPFAGAIENGRLYGWGVADDRAGVAAMVQAVARIGASGRAPGGDVIVASTPSKRHARGVAALLHGGVGADAAVYLHPAESGAGMREIKAFASGLVTFRIVVTGRQPDTTEPGHGAFAHRAINPADKMRPIHDALLRLDAGRGARVRHPALEAAIGRSTNLLVAHLSCGNAGVLGRVPAQCTLGAALAFPPPETLESVQAEIKEAVQRAAASDPWLSEHPPDLIWDSGVTGAETPAAHPLFGTAADAVRAVTGAEVHVNPLHTSSDIRNPIVQKGIPTIGLGPLCGDLTQNGRHDEWVDAADYVRSVEVATRIIAAWCDG